MFLKGLGGSGGATAPARKTTTTTTTTTLTGTDNEQLLAQLLELLNNQVLNMSRFQILLNENSSFPVLSIQILPSFSLATGRRRHHHDHERRRRNGRRGGIHHGEHGKWRKL